MVADRVEALRGLEFGDVPEPEVISAERLGRIEDREIRRSGGDAPVGRRRGGGADPRPPRPDEQLEAAQGASDELAAAAYDTETKRLYVIDDAVGASPALVEFVLAHELTHALEDQAFGLPDLTKVDDDDRALAGLALTEGSATSMMVRYARAPPQPARPLARRRRDQRRHRRGAEVRRRAVRVGLPRGGWGSSISSTMSPAAGSSSTTRSPRARR